MKILMIIAPMYFKDEEFTIPFQIFKDKGIDVDIASRKKGICIGVGGTRVEAQLDFSDVDIFNYKAIVLIGGPGSRQLVGLPVLEKLLQMAEDKNKLICAICYAPVILAKAGVLKNKKATVFNEDGLQKPILVEYGAIYFDKLVVLDYNLITANGPKAALEFGKEIVKALGIK